MATMNTHSSTCELIRHDTIDTLKTEALLSEMVHGQPRQFTDSSQLPKSCERAEPAVHPRVCQMVPFDITSYALISRHNDR
ncbi:unnamed protein product [Heligmosomoides polygyrus]|uniref:Uncharacterized protein n=1 Tax=Heligmosomoides polygyrus TaxID=6339 RepID=A0A183G9A4_HELPZ|nr:unnamed protein product [Heligmosomoides polygyrus]